MTTTTRMSAPTPKSMPWPTPQRPAQAAPVRRESVVQPAGGGKSNPVRDGGMASTPRVASTRLWWLEGSFSSSTFFSG